MLIARAAAWRIRHSRMHTMFTIFAQANTKSVTSVGPVRDTGNRTRPINWTRLPVSFPVQFFVDQSEFGSNVVE